MKKLNLVGAAIIIAGMFVTGCTKEEKVEPISTSPSASASATINITSTIVVKAGTTYDGRGNTIRASGLGDGGQGENQKPIFKLEKGATLKNVRIAAPGADGVHCYGNNLVQNVVWEDVGEDALTAKGEGWITVDGGSANSASDKVFQLNKAVTFTVKNFTATTFGKIIRQNGGSSFKCTIYIDNCTFRGNNSECIARTDSKTTQLYYRRMTVSSVKTWWIFPSSSQIHTY